MFEKFIDGLRGDRFITLETTPQRSSKFNNIIEKIDSLGLDKLVNGFSVTDNPLARLKYSALFGALMLQNRFNKPAIATMSMRDRNRIALQSDLLGANESHIRAILALTGDSAHRSDQPHAKGVFEANSNLLLEIIDRLNSGYDLAGQELVEKVDTIYPFAVSDSYSKSTTTLAKKISKKISHNAVGIITQPVYGADSAYNLLEMVSEANKEHNKNCVLILGYFPITRYKTALFLDENVPGIYIPDEWIKALESAHAKSSEHEYNVGLELSKNLFDELIKIHPKVHIMTANQFDLAKKILS